MLRLRTPGLLLLCAAISLSLAIPAASQSPIPLWPKGAPGALGNSENDVPTITMYPAPPETATGAAMVIFPGGGYGALARHEGHDYALWLNEHGVSAFVVKYRLGRIAEVTGHDLSVPDVRFQLQVALAAQRTLTVLHTEGD